MFGRRGSVDGVSVSRSCSVQSCSLPSSRLLQQLPPPIPLTELQSVLGNCHTQRLLLLPETLLAVGAGCVAESFCKLPKEFILLRILLRGRPPGSCNGAWVTPPPWSWGKARFCIRNRPPPAAATVFVLRATNGDRELKTTSVVDD